MTRYDLDPPDDGLNFFRGLLSAGAFYALVFVVYLGLRVMGVI